MKIIFRRARYTTYLAIIILFTIFFEINLDFGLLSYQTEMLFGATQKILQTQCELLGQNRGIVNWFLVCLTENIFKEFDIKTFVIINSVYTEFDSSSRIIPFIFSTALLPLIYFMTKKMTNKKHTAIITTALVATNPVYLIFNSSQYFSQIWVFFFLLSIIFLYYKPIGLSVPFFILTLLAKIQPLLYIPAFIYIARKKSKKVFLIFIGIPIAIFIYQLGGGTLLTSDNIQALQTNENKIFEFTVIEGILKFPSSNLIQSEQIEIKTPVIETIYKLAFSWNLLAMTIPLTLWYLLKTKRYEIFCFLAVILASIFILPLFTPHITFTYRTLPLIIFQSIGIATIISDLIDRRKKVKALAIFLSSFIPYILLILYEWNGTNFDFLIF